MRYKWLAAVTVLCLGCQDRGSPEADSATQREGVAGRLIDGELADSPDSVIGACLGVCMVGADRIAVTGATKLSFIDANTGKILKSIGSAEPYRVCKTDTGLATVGWGQLLTFWGRNGTQRHSVSTGRVTELVSSNSGKLIATCGTNPSRLESGGSKESSSDGSNSDVVQVWNSSGEEVWCVPSGERKTNSVCFSPDERTVFSCGTDGSVSVWDLTERKRSQLLRCSKLPLSVVAASPQGSRIACMSFDLEVFLWRLTSKGWKREREFKLEDALCDPVHIVFSNDGRKLVATGVKSVHVCDLPSGRSKRLGAKCWTTGEVVSSTSGPIRLAVSPDNRSVLVADAEGTLSKFMFVEDGSKQPR